ncbi:MAG: hypothetical protein VX475_10490, partial [Myxococcota bacterium]|nr:hypothetical protein [Myxococcota bacterium]
MRRTPIKFCAMAALASVMLTSSLAQARDNDLVLSRFSTFEPEPCQSNPEEICGQVVPDSVSFNNLVLDLGEVFAPRIGNPAETLGQAGFAFSAMGSVSFIPNTNEYWQLVVEDGDPPPAMFTGHVQVRKGLPF